MFLAKKTTPVFVLGCQRSGTTMFQDMFGVSRHVDVLGESDKRAMTDKWRMRGEDVIEDLVRHSDKKVMLFKPLNDSQWADKLLADFPSGRAIWMIRSPFDTVNSAVAKWGSAQLDMMTWIADVIAGAGSLEKAAPTLRSRPGFSTYAERLSAEDCETLLKWRQLPLDDHAGAAILWYLRNRFFFELNLNMCERAMVTSYEELVQFPENEIRKICEFIGLRYSKKYAKDLHTRSIGKSPRPVLPPEIEEAIVDLHGKLTSVFNRQHQRAPEYGALQAGRSC